jgi:hypothetical protein
MSRVMNNRKYWKTELPMALSALCISSVAFAAYPRLPTDAQLLSEVYGSYAPSGDCLKQPRINVDKTGIHLDTAAGKRGPLPMSVSLTWIGGASYSGIQTWALIKHGGKDRYGDDKTPVVLTFNAGEKRGVLTAERTGSGKERPATLDGPLNSIVQAAGFRLCRAGSLPIDR